MNRLLARRFAGNSCLVRVPWRSFCDAAAVNSGTAQAKHAEKQRLTSHSEEYDVAIVGGGMVGMAVACSLASMSLTKHLNVAIIDSNPALVNGITIKKEDPPDPRVSTVTPATISLFKEIGAWEYVQQHRHAYFDKMQVWDYTGLGYTRYNARDVSKEVLGCVVENKVLQSSLLSCIQNADIRKTVFPARLTSMNLNPSSIPTELNGTSSTSPWRGFARLELSDGTCIHAKLVQVGADGSKSNVRELSGFKTTGWNYAQNAIICTVEHTVENNCAWQRFLPSGPIAVLPIGENFSNIVWTMSPNESSELKSLTESDFIKSVNHALDYGYGPHPKSSSARDGDLSWFGAGLTSSAGEGFTVPPRVVRLASERMVFPLSLKHANSYVAKHVALVGDAAHTVHPLAGQGVNLGFGDAFALSRVIGEGIAVGSDIGEVSLLRRYEAERRPANIVMMAILDGFQKVYSIDFGPLNIVRAAAFNAANYFSPLKRNIISYASGEQRLPLFT
ncbi:ubiquinone biosynthesis monooxygenase COQ6, mitochondrial isoform X1 [Punica granatum]|uniref:Ubiquinone biosynthesis monooxygenase COQ6, mitochondrial n=1 Tax=Punica granatum TaxID=22663 RepID=A0A6P8CJW1_PUNGR|nr:ubiquinone biosynthesis monooxygenase COQ6, mitochondrial isoform X1 [Punica granatum]XP_031380849.1 ubiquinone biosynthesis monooxygenase COQ6, mitochondrial isoform X1 [Punica granatum]